MNPIVKFLQNVLLVIELFFVILFVHWEKVLFVGIIALDQYSKMRIVESMTAGESIPILKNFFHITYILNPGAAFGILPNQRVFFLVIGAALLLGFVIFYPRLRKAHWFLKFGVISLVSGATANLIDRIQTGRVVDFIDFRFGAIFNFADVAVVSGMFILFYVIIFKMDDSENSKEHGNEF